MPDSRLRPRRIIAGRLAAPSVHNCHVPEFAVAAKQDAAGPAAAPLPGQRRAAALLAPQRSGFDAEEPALTAARECAALVLARLPVEHAPPVARPVPLVSVEISALVEGLPSRERAVRSSAGPEDDLARAESESPVPIAASPRAAYEHLPRERGARNSASPEDDLAWTEAVATAVPQQAARERRLQERGARNSVGPGGDPARAQLPARLAAVVGPIGGLREAPSGREPDRGNSVGSEDVRGPAAPFAQKVHVRAAPPARMRQALERPVLRWSGSTAAGGG